LTATTRPPLAAKMLERVKKQGDYHEDVPKHWMSDEHGMEHALVKYVEQLEANQKPDPKTTSLSSRLRSMGQQLRRMAKAAEDNRGLQDLLERAAENVEDARSSMSSKRRAKKPSASDVHWADPDQ